MQTSPVNSAYTPTEHLARDIAQRLLDKNQICEKHGITIHQLTYTLQNPAFQKVVKDHIQIWLESSNVDERVRVKARMAEEAGLLKIHEIISDPMSANSDRIAAFKTLQTSAGPQKSIAEQEKGKANSGGSGINIQINLNGERHEMSFDPIDIDQIETERHTPDGS